MENILKKIFGKKDSAKVINIVSGLPRSGTSMMMQMLEAGGMPIVTDNIRKPDNDNPRGYLEFEKAMQIKDDASWLEDCYGKAFKMVSSLLHYLPGDKRYRVIFMEREMGEILASQRVMLENLGLQDHDVDDMEMGRKFENHCNIVRAWLSTRSNVDVIYLKYNNIIKHPVKYARLVCRFLSDRPLDEKKMAHVVEKALYRHKKKAVR